MDKAKFLRTKLGRTVAGLATVSLTGLMILSFQNCSKFGSSSQSSTDGSLTKALKTAPVGSWTSPNGTVCLPVRVDKLVSRAIPGMITTSLTHQCTSKTGIVTYPISRTHVRGGKIIMTSRSRGLKPDFF